VEVLEEAYPPWVLGEEPVEDELFVPLVDKSPPFPIPTPPPDLPPPPPPLTEDEYSSRRKNLMIKHKSI